MSDTSHGQQHLITLPSHAVMAKRSNYNDMLTAELVELRDRVERLERQNQGLLALGQNNITSRSHTTLKPVKEEENESESSLQEEREVGKESEEDDYVGCFSLLYQLTRHAKSEGKEVLQKIKALTKRVSDVDCEKAAPKRLVREYKLRRLRKQWRAVIRESVAEEGCRSTTSSEKETNSSGVKEAELGTESDGSYGILVAETLLCTAEPGTDKGKHDGVCGVQVHLQSPD